MSITHNAVAENEWKTYSVTIDDKQLEIPYRITNGDIRAIQVDVDFGSLIISIDSFEDGSIQLKLFKVVIDADYDEYLVLIDGEESTYDTLEIASDFRTIEIPFIGDTEEIEIIGSKFEPLVPVSQSTVRIGGHLIDGYYVVYANEQKATWEASPLVLYSNGTLSVNLKMNYLSEDPTVARICHCYTATQPTEVVAENIKPVASAVFLDLGIVVSFQGNVGGYSIGRIIPAEANSLNEKSAEALITFNFPNLANSTTGAGGLTLRVAWVRIFEDADGNRYYQWMQPHETYDEHSVVKVNEKGNISGSFLVYYPIPEEYTQPLDTFDYARWIRETILKVQDRSVIVTGKDQPDFMKHFVIEPKDIWINKMELDHTRKAVVAFLGGTYYNSSLTLKLPREMIDAKSDGSDKNFLVLIDGKHEAKHFQINQTSSYRTLLIEIPAGTAYVRIIGTTVVPEFPHTALTIFSGVVLLAVITRLMPKPSRSYDITNK
ncbi:MAG: hypothetical protein HMLIMOIP_000566 [Candidatus Nitrosomirales archaeon]|jgi:hypothetical protein